MGLTSLMGAAVAGIGMSLLKGFASRGGLIPRPGADQTTVIVKIGRVTYIGSVVYIAGLWYWAWRNERVDPGTGKFPIPGIFKGPVSHPGGATDAGDAPSMSLTGSTSAPATSGGGSSAPTVIDASSLPGGSSGGGTLLVQLGNLGRSKFHVTPTQHPRFGGVTQVHVTGSYHYKGRAIDFIGPLGNLATWAHFLATAYLPQIKELIWNGPSPIFIKDGKLVPPSVYSDVLASHKTHVHLAI